EHRAGGNEEALHLPGSELRGLAKRREASAVQDLVGVGVADAVEESRVRERALQRMVLAQQGVLEVIEAGAKNVQAASIEAGEGRLSGEDVQRGPLLRAGLREENGAVIEVKRGEPVSTERSCKVREALLALGASSFGFARGGGCARRRLRWPRSDD